MTFVIANSVTFTNPKYIHKKKTISLIHKPRLQWKNKEIFSNESLKSNVKTFLHVLF